ncbi:MAG TPA: DNA polymerase I, partial [Clostridiales bacterium]|nr:DNA polymerase I [Clostridiales bacterium]
TEAGLQTVIVTGDRDALQLVSPTVNVWLTRRGITDVETYDEAAVSERYSLTPRQLIDLKALMGDSSDNIPGVPGIGEKTGIKLLKAAGTLDDLLAHPEVYASKKTLERLRTYRDQAYLSRYLGTIVCDLPLALGIDDLKRQPADYQQVAAVYREYELKSLLEKLPLAGLESVEQDTEVHQCEWKLVNSADDLAELAQLLAKHPRCALATDVIDSVPYLALTFADGLTYIVPCSMPGLGAALAQSKTPELIGHDLKSMTVALAKAGIELPAPAGDTLLAAYLLDPSQNSYHLDQLAKTHLNKALQQPEQDAQAALAAASAIVWPLLEELEAKLAEFDLDNLYRNVELPLSHVLAAMELQGVHVDRTTLLEMQADLEQRLALIMQEIYDAAGQEFNLNSPKQLGHILFEQLRLPVIKKTRTGYSTDAEVLDALADEHVVVSKILEYRQLAKLKSTYLDGLLQVIDAQDDKVHTTYHQTVTTTGRLSSSEPNLQNIPVRLDEGRRIRKAFLPAAGASYIMSADYSQIELRILAHISEDDTLINAFWEGHDIHALTASRVFGVPLNMVTDEMRKRAKAVNFGIVYGIGGFSLSEDIGVSLKEANKYIDSYFAKYPKVKEYMDSTIESAKKDGYVTTLLGRRRYIPVISSPKAMLRSFGERVAMNTPIQGTAADIIKKAMIETEKALIDAGLKSRLVLQIHDELIVESPVTEADRAKEILVRSMENAYKMRVPLSVDAHIGKTWYDAKM